MVAVAVVGISRGESENDHQRGIHDHDDNEGFGDIPGCEERWHDSNEVLCCFSICDEICRLECSSSGIETMN